MRSLFEQPDSNDGLVKACYFAPTLISPVVTIDVMPADAPAEYAPAMVAACSQSLPAGKCALARGTPESTPADAVALVLWQGDQYLQVTVRVGRHGSAWVTRNLSFTERDALLDRWTAVGLTVATLVGEEEPAPPSEPPAPAPGSENVPREDIYRPSVVLPPTVATPPPRRLPRPKATAPRRLEFNAAFGGLLGSAWREGDWQRGLWLSATVGLGGKPWLLEGFASYAQSNGPEVAGRGALQSSWSSAGVGFGAASDVRALNLRGSVALELLVRWVSADLGATHASDAEVPVRLRFLGAWPARGPLGLVLGSALRVPFTDAPNGGVGQARQPLFAIELQAGLEIRL